MEKKLDWMSKESAQIVIRYLQNDSGMTSVEAWLTAKHFVEELDKRGIPYPEIRNELYQLAEMKPTEVI
jgi:hypothetical protein